jgi:hypothetical protein
MADAGIAGGYPAACPAGQLLLSKIVPDNFVAGGYPAACPAGQLKLSQFAPGKLVEPNGGSHLPLVQLVV